MACASAFGFRAVLDIDRALGSVLREARQHAALSQESLAAQAGINRTYLGEIERGEAVPSLTTLVKLAHALHLRPSALVARCEPPVD